MRVQGRKSKAHTVHITEGAENVFADLGFSNPEQELLKARLTLQIHTILRESGMKQNEIGKVLGISQPQVSLLMRNRAGSFSVGRLIEFLTALRRDVQIVIRPARKEHGVLSVVTP